MIEFEFIAFGTILGIGLLSGLYYYLSNRPQKKFPPVDTQKVIEERNKRYEI